MLVKRFENGCYESTDPFNTDASYCVLYVSVCGCELNVYVCGIHYLVSLKYTGWWHSGQRVF